MVDQNSEGSQQGDSENLSRRFLLSRGAVAGAAIFSVAGCTEAASQDENTPTATGTSLASGAATNQQTPSNTESATRSPRDTPTETRETSPTQTESPTAPPTPTESNAAIVDLTNRRDQTEKVSVRVVDTTDGTVLLEETVTVTPPGSRSWDDVVDPGTTVRVEVQVDGGKSAERKMTITERNDGRKPGGIYITLFGKYNDPDEIRISRPDL